MSEDTRAGVGEEERKRRRRKKRREFFSVSRAEKRMAGLVRFLPAGEGGNPEGEETLLR